uniref:GUN4-like domain-containing protein n=1 Tax=Pyramimonas obovata TaxID=1411642 RepID=A0A7S0QZ37_9CHLO|mmetsp:Transcript_19197/g.42011  ORF Transcript_19197/g.42011 Transcript_19197/m.42011 type:complete len:270 (+) Transcript_19197:92-901(+)
MNTLAASQIRAACRPSFKERGTSSVAMRPCRRPAAVLGDKPERLACASLNANRKCTPFTASRSRTITWASAAEVEAKTTEEEKKPEKKISVALESELDIDYTPLETALKEGNFREADDLTRALLITIAGEDAELREFVYFTEVKSMPVTDLKTIDNLWTAYSDGKFGYSVQRGIWKSGQVKEKWGKFFKKLDWTVGENNSYRSWANNEYIYSMDAAKGHLPLTSCLRGTQLLRGLLEHPAFAPASSGNAKAGGKDAGSSSGGKPSWLKF